MALIRPIPTKSEPVISDVVYGRIASDSNGIRFYNASTDTISTSTGSGTQLSVTSSNSGSTVTVTALEAGTYRVLNEGGASLVTASAGQVLLNTSGSTNVVCVYKVE